MSATGGGRRGRGREAPQQSTRGRAPYQQGAGHRGGRGWAHVQAPQHVPSQAPVQPQQQQVMYRPDVVGGRGARPYPVVPMSQQAPELHQAMRSPSPSLQFPLETTGRYCISWYFRYFVDLTANLLK
jgi:hypothetical protein